MESGNQSSDKTCTKTEDTLFWSQAQFPVSSCSNGSSIIFEHPLLNPLIVDLIVEHLDPNFDQLKTLRLVSKVWTQVTLNQWRKSGAVLTLVPDPPTFSKTNYKEGVTVSRFLREFQNPQSPFQLSQKPFLKYKLKDFTLDFEECSHSQPDGMVSDQFWNQVGPLMEYVHFFNTKFVKPVRTQNAICPLVQFIVGMIPNLKDLALTNVATAQAENSRSNIEAVQNDDSEMPEVVPSPHSNLRSLTVYGDLQRSLPVNYLFKLAPKLEVIKGNNGMRNYNRMDENLLGVVYEVRNYSTSIPPALSSLKHVDLMDAGILWDEDYNWNTRHLEREPAPIGIPPAPLETLCLHVEANSEDFTEMENLDSLLQSFSSTLLTFTAFRAPVGLPYSEFLSGFSMTSLKELHLLGTIAPSFEFLRSVPSLKELKIDLGCYEKRELTKDIIMEHADDEEQWKYQKYEEDMVAKVPRHLRDGILCSELECLEVDYEFPEESLRLLGKWMPNLKTLKTILSVETVPVVCELWGDLTELVCLFGSKIENSCFIRDDEIAGFSGNPAALPKLKICGLNDLERFKLDAYCDEIKLTDDVVYEGFLKMPSLKYVDICVNAQMSAKAEEALRKGIPFCKVVRDDHDECCGSFGNEVSSYRCDRCGFRREAEMYGLRDYADDDSSGNRESDNEGNYFWRRHLGESDEDEFRRPGSDDSNDSSEIW